MHDPVRDPTTPVPAARDGEPQQRVLLHMPVDVRSVSLAVLALLACLFAMQWAKEVLIPVLLGVMVYYALTPLVDRLHRWRVPRALSAGLLLASIAGAIGWTAWSLSDEADALIQTLPQVSQKIRRLTEGKRGAVSTIEKVQQAATELEAAATEQPPAAAPTQAAPAASGQASAVPRRPRAAATASRTAPVPERPHIDVRGYLLSGTLGALAFLGQATVVFFIALFLLASGDTFRRKMVKLAGPRLSQKKLTIETLDEINGQIQRYLLVQVGVSLIVGIATWVAFFALGLEQSAVWGVVAGVTNLIPYLGAVIVGAASAVSALVQFGSVEMALLVGGTSFGIHTLIGNLLTPWWMGRASSMNPFAVFVAVLAFGWLWGVWGLLLGMPILLAVKAVCDRIDGLKPIGELLGA